MGISAKIEYIRIEDLKLDPKNPRLPENQHGLSQEGLLDAMADWGLEELGASVARNGFWAHEALLIVREKLTPKDQVESIVVVEGNRRLAAVKLLLNAHAGQPRNHIWETLASTLTKTEIEKLKKLPTIEAGKRRDVDFFLGFRNFTGIKQWELYERSAFIAKLIDDGFSYEEVTQGVGTKITSVRQHYIAYNLFHQLEEIEGISAERVRNRFSVLLLSLRSSGTREYLGIDIEATPEEARTPLKPEFHANAVRFARWLFGDDEHEPLLSDSRNTDRFGLALASKEARAYLERTENPRFEVAVRLSGGDLAEVIRHVERASDEIEEVLSVVQHYSEEPDLIQATRRLFKNIEALSDYFSQVIEAGHK